MSRLVDLSHPIRHGLVTYPGLPAPEISDHLSRDASKSLYAPGTTFHIGRISMVANTGTYLDSPFHRFPDGVDLAGLPLEKLADLDGVCVAPQELEGADVRAKAVLIRTGWDRHWNTPQYGIGAPFVTAAQTRFLVENGAALVGIDSVNIDDMSDKTRPAHTGLLAAGIPIVEHLRGLDQLPPRGFRFSAVPPRIEQFGTFPVRAWASLAGAAMRVLALALLLPGLVLAAPAPADPAAEITALLNEFLAKVDDPAMHERFWADDLIYTSAAGVVKTKAAILQSMRAGDTPGTRDAGPEGPKATFSAEDVRVRPLAAGVAVLNFRLVHHAGAETHHFRNSGTFVKRGGRWQVVSWQATREGEPPK